MSSQLLKRRPVGGATRKGLTLLELVVVVAILAALAGILVPLLPSLMYRTHAATGATNNVEVTKAVQLYAGLTNQQYPNQLDSIVVGSTLATYVLNGPSAAPQLSADTLQPGEATALSNAGITRVAPMIENPGTTNTTDYQNDWAATFFPYGNDVSVTPTFVAPTHAAFITPAVVAQKFGGNWPGNTSGSKARYAVFGLGKFSTIVGTGMDEAPVWFNPGSTNGVSNDPNTTYSRFGLVFQVADDSGAALTTASFVGVVELGGWGVASRDDNLNFFYSETK
jgi:prepilin-type N-terminal cleavage/methylation domain-containing protein